MRSPAFQSRALSACACVFAVVLAAAGAPASALGCASSNGGEGTNDGGPAGSGATSGPGVSTGDDGGQSSTTNAGSDGGTSCGGGGGPTGGPGDLFPCNSSWRKDVSALPVADESSTIIGAVPSWGASIFQIDFSIVFMHAAASDPTATFTLQVPDESDKDPVPIPAVGSVEGETGYNCTGGGDCHLLIVDDTHKKLFEMYAADHSSGSWNAYQETVWDLTHSYDGRERGLGCTSADAAGLSVMAGLIGVRETKADAIHHALRFILPNRTIRTGPSFVAPASHGTSSTSSPSGPPYGTRFRLKSSFDETKVASAGAKAIVHALKTYGMILADAGNIPLVAEDDKLEKAADPTMTWDGLLDSHDLAGIDPSDFDVVDYGTLVTHADCSLMTGL